MARTDFAAVPRYDIRQQALFIHHRAPEADPRRAEEDRLPANRIHARILDAAQRSGAQSGAHSERVGHGAACVRTLRGLRDVLQPRALDAPTAGEEAREEEIQVDGRVDRQRRVGDAEGGAVQ